MANNLNRNIVQLCVHETEELVRSEKCYLEKWATSLALKNRQPELEEHRKTNQDHWYSERGLPYSAMAFMARSSSCLFSHLISACFTSKPLKIPSPTVKESRLQGGGDRDVWLTELSSLVVGIGSGGNWGQGTAHCHQLSSPGDQHLSKESDQTVPTPKYQTVANCYLLVCLLIYFLSSFSCTFPTGQNALAGGCGGSSPGPLSALEQEGPHLGSIQLGFTSCLPCLCHILSPLASQIKPFLMWFVQGFCIPLKHYSSS